MIVIARHRLIALLACTAVLTSACGDDGSSSASTTTAVANSTTTTDAPAYAGPCGTDEQLVELLGASSSAAHETQLESILSAANVAALGADTTISEDVEEQRERADAAAEALQDAALSVDIDLGQPVGAHLADAIQAAESRLEGRDLSRAAADELQVTAQIARQNDAHLTRSLIAIIKTALPCPRRMAVVNGLLDLVLFSGYKASFAELDAIVTSITTTAKLDANDRADLEAALDGREDALMTISQLGFAELKALVRKQSTSDADLVEIAAQILTSPSDAPIPMTGEEWRSGAIAQLEELRSIEVALLDAMEPPS